MPGNLRFSFFLISIAVILIVAPLFQKGLFIDGLLYKTVAYNFSQGEGSFWKMKFTDVSMNPFYEQPPLYFFITGIYYELFGASLVADRMLTIIFLALSVLLIRKCCRILFGREESLFLIVCLFLLSIQVLCWSYVNQMIEALVLLFSLLSLYIFLKGIEAQNVKRSIYALAFGLMIPLLFLTKGFQSCFIITLPFFYSLFFRNRTNLLFLLGSSTVSALLLWLIFFQHNPSAEWFLHYSQKRLLASMNNVGATTDNHFEIIFRIFTEMIFPLVIIIVLFFRLKVLRVNHDKTAYVLLLTAVAGSFPFAITLEQRGFYLVPSFPFYVLGLTILFKDHLSFFYLKLKDLFSKRIAGFVVALILAGSLTYLAFSFSLYKRDENLIKDLALIESGLPENDTISITEEMWNNVPLHGYVYMHLKTNLEPGSSHPFLIHDRTVSEKPDSLYRKIELPTLQYDLYSKRMGAER